MKQQERMDRAKWKEQRDHDMIRWYDVHQRIRPRKWEAWLSIRLLYEAATFKAVIEALTRTYMKSMLGMHPKDTDFPLEWATALRDVADDVETHHFQLLSKGASE